LSVASLVLFLTPFHALNGGFVSFAEMETGKVTIFLEKDFYDADAKLWLYGGNRWKGKKKPAMGLTPDAGFVFISAI
jgi:hypothetical protein